MWLALVWCRYETNRKPTGNRWDTHFLLGHHGCVSHPLITTDDNRELYIQLAGGHTVKFINDQMKKESDKRWKDMDFYEKTTFDFSQGFVGIVELMEEAVHRVIKRANPAAECPEGGAVPGILKEYGARIMKLSPHYEGMSGNQMFTAIGYLSACWLHGEALAKWRDDVEAEMRKVIQ